LRAGRRLSGKQLVRIDDFLLRVEMYLVKKTADVFTVKEFVELLLGRRQENAKYAFAGLLYVRQKS